MRLAIASRAAARTLLSLSGAAIVAATLLLAPQRADAAGAVAIGLPDNVVTGGIAIGRSWNFGSEREARERALHECRTFQDAPPQTRELCRVIRVFRNECSAVALDPQAGTPGYGWAVAETRALAEEDALRLCRHTAGNRARYCKLVGSTGCDGR